MYSYMSFFYYHNKKTELFVGSFSIDKAEMLTIINIAL